VSIAECFEMQNTCMKETSGQPKGAERLVHACVRRLHAMAFLAIWWDLLGMFMSGKQFLWHG